MPASETLVDGIVEGRRRNNPAAAMDPGVLDRIFGGNASEARDFYRRLETFFGGFPGGTPVKADPGPSGPGALGQLEWQGGPGLPEESAPL
jgi:hypothetical protein